MVDLDHQSLQTVKKILDECLPGITVKAFGSRVTGKAKQYSDLDLVIINDMPIDNQLMNEIKFQFSDSDLPIMVDIIDWHAITDKFRQVIQSQCVDFR